MEAEYTDEVLEEINNKSDLIAYVSQYINLKKRGDTYYAHCPKHVDKTASLAFRKDGHYYHCFSCGLSGDMIQYLRDYEGLSFKDAVEKASKIANVDTRKMCMSNTMKFLRRLKRLSEKNDSTKNTQHEILKDTEYLKYRHEPINEWLEEGIEQDIMDLFGIRADTLQNRIIYPVYDINGNLINIKGRTRYPNFKALDIPKYINYFSVGTMDYFQGLNITLPYIKNQNEAIIFESIKSVMLAYGWGYQNCVSAEKHNLTNEQINLLLKLRVNVVFAYDSDINYYSPDVIKDINKLKQMTNVYIITDPQNLLGGKEAKNAPVDMGKEIWKKLYEHKKKVV